MKTLTDNLNEALKIGKDISNFSTYSCHPATRNELKSIVYDRIDKDGPNCNLNDIDTSLIEDMSWLFNESSFNGDISEWDTSNVTNMEGMFYRSKFTGDISKWNVNKVTNMIHIFRESKFNQDISNWKISEDCNISRMFYKCPIRKEYKPR